MIDEKPDHYHLPPKAPPVLMTSELQEEIVVAQPGRLTMWGNGFFLLFLLLLVLLSWFIHYPEVVVGPAKLTCINAPKPVVSQVSGRLVKLLVSDKKEVKEGDPLCYLESTGNHDEVLKVSLIIDSLHMAAGERGFEASLPYYEMSKMRLGELQVFAQRFLDSYLNYQNYFSDGLYERQFDYMVQQRANLVESLKNLNEQKQLHEKDLELHNANFEMHKSLKSENVVSEADFRGEESKFINKKLSIPQIKALIIQTESELINLEKQMLEVENTLKQQKLLFQQALMTFKSEIDQWKKKYVPAAPVNGAVVFQNSLQINESIEMGEQLFYVDPGKSNFYAEVMVPQMKFGKVANGQKVYLKFAAYPSDEFGSLPGRVSHISTVPVNDSYFVRIDISPKFLTTYNKAIRYHTGLVGSAEIVTRDARLLERFFFGLRSLFDE